MIFPSGTGLKPRLAAWMPEMIDLISEASHGWIWMRRASGVEMAAQLFSGCIEP